MSLLETFSILFDSNASDTKKEVGDSMKEIAVDVMKAYTAFLSLDAIMEGFSSAIEFADKINEVSETLEISTEELSSWGDAAKLFGGSAEATTSSLGSLSAALQQVDVMGKSRMKPFFDELGIQLVGTSGKVRPVMDVLGDLAGKFEYMSKQESFGFGRKIGLDDGTIRLLQQGTKGLKEAVEWQKKLGAVTAEEGKVADEFGDTLDDTKHAFRTLFMEMSTEVLPTITHFLKMVQEGTFWVREHTGVVKTFGAIMGTAMGFMAVEALVKFVKAAQMAKIAALEAGAAEAVMTAPLWLTVAAIAAFAAAIALVVEDFQVWADGGDSMIGQWVGSFQDFEDYWFPMIDEVIAKIQELIEWWGKVQDKISGGLGDAADTVGGWIDKGKNMLGIATETPIASQSSGAILAGGNTSKSSNVKIDNVNVQTKATDADGISKDIGGSLQTEMANTVAAFDDGVSH